MIFFSVIFFNNWQEVWWGRWSHYPSLRGCASSFQWRFASSRGPNTPHLSIDRIKDIVRHKPFDWSRCLDWMGANAYKEEGALFIGWAFGVLACVATLDRASVELIEGLSCIRCHGRLCTASKWEVRALGNYSAFCILQMLIGMMLDGIHTRDARPGNYSAFCILLMFIGMMRNDMQLWISYVYGNAFLCHNVHYSTCSFFVKCIILFLN